jgi:hydroxyacylglutathione hydrolase
MAGDPDLTFVDTRVDRAAVMRAHLPGAFYAPLNAMFCTVVGSLIADWEARIVLVARQRDVEEATRRLVRIGYDGAAGYVEPDTLQAYFDATGNQATIETIDFAGLDRHKKKALRSSMCAAAPSIGRPMSRGPCMRPTRGSRVHWTRCRKAASFWCIARSGARASVAAAYLARTGRDVTVVNDEFANYKGG